MTIFNFEAWGGAEAGSAEMESSYSFWGVLEVLGSFS